MVEQKEIKDSGQRTEYANGFVRDMHEGKGRFDLMPLYAIWELAKHCEAGAKKYGERNIDLGCPQHSLIDSAFRHLAKYTLGMDDEDHLRAALWNIAWAVQQDVIMPEMQDIPARMKDAPVMVETEKVVEQIHEYFNLQADERVKESTDEYPIGLINDLLKHNKAVCEIVRKGGVPDETCKG